MLPKYDSRRSHWLFFGKVRSGLGSRAQRTLERIRPAKGASRTAPFFLPSRWVGRATLRKLPSPGFGGGMAAPTGRRRVIAPQQARLLHVKMSNPLLLPVVACPYFGSCTGRPRRGVAPRSTSLPRCRAAFHLTQQRANHQHWRHAGNLIGDLRRDRRRGLSGFARSWRPRVPAAAVPVPVSAAGAAGRAPSPNRRARRVARNCRRSKIKLYRH